jgi:hypothetical protein
MAELKVAAEIALADFTRMCDARRINLDDAEWTEEEKKSFASLRKLICDAISRGSVTVDANADPVFSFGTPPVKLGKITGAALLAMDGKIENARIFAGLATIAGIGVSHFANFDVQDIHLLKAFYVLFFQR